jgi:hypothetical protein
MDIWLRAPPIIVEEDRDRRDAWRRRLLGKP